MNLSELLSGVEVLEIIQPGEPGPELLELAIAEVRDDSRQVQPGDLFVALPGQRVDGHRFLGDAAARGARAALVERPAAGLGLPQLRVSSTMAALARIAANRYGQPAEQLCLVGVTGTNGKSTTTFLVEALLRQAGLDPGLIGTLFYRHGGNSAPAPFTTPPPLLLHRTLAEMRAAGARAVVMEVSSHALQLGRLGGVRFRVGAFTNLTQDHLDFHGDMESYFAAKARLFREHLLPAAEGGVAVVHSGGDYGPRMAEAARAAGARVLTVSTRSEAGDHGAPPSAGPAPQGAPTGTEGRADVAVREAQLSLAGIRATLRTPVGEVALRSSLIGQHNLENLALAAGIGAALGLPAALIGEGLSAVPGVPGRLERVSPPAGASGPAVFVDYAHTPDALARALGALRGLAGAGDGSGPGRLVVVFGCGGDRDRDKRPKMGQAAAAGADLVVITTDNPRGENPTAIAEMIVAGLGATDGHHSSLSPALSREELVGARRGHHVELDRRRAIQAAVRAASAADLVLIAGKGHEDYQIVGAERRPFDDRLVAREALEGRGEGGPPEQSPPSIELPIERVLQATGGQLVRGAPRRFSQVVIDGRKAGPGALFVAVRGERHDGHAFVGQATLRGAAGVLVERGRGAELGGLPPDTAVIEVPDPMVALGQLARAHREAPEIAKGLQVVAVTGSTGKTSTKDLLSAILSAHAPGAVLATSGNLNNHLGVPLTLLGLRAGLRYAVIEMGMSARGEIAYLTQLAQPDVGVITNVGPVHLESLGDIQNVARAKGELLSELADGGVAVYPVGPGHELLQAEAVRAGARSGRLRPLCVFSGEGEPPPGTAVRATAVRETPDGVALRLVLSPPGTEGPEQVIDAQLGLLGAHQAANAALAAAAALGLDVPAAAIAAGLQAARRGKHRGQVLDIGGRHILDDCYNASPPSVRAALSSLAALKAGGRAIAVLGDMLELGPTGPALHEEVLRFARGRADLVIAVGPLMTAAGGGAVPAADAETAAALCAEQSRPGDWVLVKGSRGMRMERVVERLRELLDETARGA